jgi:hypothetical protein
MGPTLQRPTSSVLNGHARSPTATVPGLLPTGCRCCAPTGPPLPPSRHAIPGLLPSFFTCRAGPYTPHSHLSPLPFKPSEPLSPWPPRSSSQQQPTSPPPRPLRAAKKERVNPLQPPVNIFPPRRRELHGCQLFPHRDEQCNCGIYLSIPQGTPVRCETHGPFLLHRRPPELPCRASLSTAPIAFRRHPRRQRASLSPDSPVHAQRVVPSSLVLGAKTPPHLGHRLAGGSHAAVSPLGTVTAQSARRACRASLGWPGHFGCGLGHPQQAALAFWARKRSRLLTPSL